MWKRIPIDRSARYVLELCQDERRVRYLHPRLDGSPPSKDRLLETHPVDGDLIADYRVDELRRAAVLSSGERFLIGPHGEWFTETERNDINLNGWNRVRWIGGVMPNLPPR